MTATEPTVEPVTRCGACGQEDDHPKHQISVGFNNQHTDGMFHPHDHDRDGMIFYHFDCPSPWHDLHTNLATVPFPSSDPQNAPSLEWLPESAAEHRTVADRHAAIVEAARGGLKGDQLRAWIKEHNAGAGGVRGGAGGIDQTMANAILDALGPNSATQTIGAKTITGPISMRLMTANGSDTAAGTELATSGGYTAGGAALAFASAATGAKSTNAAVSWTNMPATTLTGMEEWDASATKQRTFWGPWSGGNISVASGNTFTVASASLTNSLT